MPGSTIQRPSAILKRSRRAVARRVFTTRGSGGTADALASGASWSNPVEVQILSSAPAFAHACHTSVSFGSASREGCRAEARRAKADLVHSELRLGPTLVSPADWTRTPLSGKIRATSERPSWSSRHTNERMPMRKLSRFSTHLAALTIALLAGWYLVTRAAAAGAGRPRPGAPPQPMSFFITSVAKGDGANYGGLAGADAHCQQLGDGRRTRRAASPGMPT